VPRVEFVENAIGRAKAVEVTESVAIVDLCDEYLAPVPFSCRSASCATCQIEVIEGLDLLEPPEFEEKELLALLAGPPNLRLACQAKVKPGPGLVRIKPAGC
jgi:ferredoxin